MFEELQGRAREKAEKEAKKRKLAREDFSSLLRHTHSIEADTTWEEATAVLHKEPEFKQVRCPAWPCLMQQLGGHVQCCGGSQVRRLREHLLLNAYACCPCQATRHYAYALSLSSSSSSVSNK